MEAHEATTPRGRQGDVTGPAAGPGPGPFRSLPAVLAGSHGFPRSPDLTATVPPPDRLPGEFLWQVVTPPGESPVSGDALLPRLRSLPARLIDQHNGAVSAQQVDQYLDALEEPKRTTLAQLRQTILDILPEAEQGISYGVPAFKVRGKTIAGFAAFKNHLSYLPHSGSVFPQLTEELTGYPTSSGALRFSTDQPLPRSLVEKLIAVRLRQAFPA